MGHGVILLILIPSSLTVVYNALSLVAGVTDRLFDMADDNPSLKRPPPTSENDTQHDTTVSLSQDSQSEPATATQEGQALQMDNDNAAEPQEAQASSLLDSIIEADDAVSLDLLLA